MSKLREKNPAEAKRVKQHSKHIETLMDLPKVEKYDDLKCLRVIYDKTETAIRSLQSIKVTTESYGTVISPIILSKLPAEFCLTISRKLDEEWDFKKVLRIFWGGTIIARKVRTRTHR